MQIQGSHNEQVHNFEDTVYTWFEQAEIGDSEILFKTLLMKIKCVKTSQFGIDYIGYKTMGDKKRKTIHGTRYDALMVAINLEKKYFYNY